jgi:DNA modification methylase
MIIHGHTLTVLKGIPSESLQMCVTSPPYFWLRDYHTPHQIWDGDDSCTHEWTQEIQTKTSSTYNQGMNERTGNAPGQKKQEHSSYGRLIHGCFCKHCGAWKGEHGLEPSAALYIKHSVDIFREVRRIIRKDGICFLNIGDKFNSGKSVSKDKEKWPAQSRNRTDSEFAAISSEIHEKESFGIPWMLMFALRDDGWRIRQEIIWDKPNCMAESVKDRCTKSHESIFLLFKQTKYYFDGFAIKEPAKYDGRKQTFLKPSEKYLAEMRVGQISNTMHTKGTDRFVTIDGVPVRNKRSVWKINTVGIDEKHYATFPIELPTICIKAGTSEYGCCENCRTPYKRILAPSARYAAILGKGYHDHENDLEEGKMGVRGENRQNAMRDAGIIGAEYETTGWAKQCKCETDKVIPCTVLDPFIGAGTTELACIPLQRDCIGIELGEEAVEISTRRTGKEKRNGIQHSIFNPKLVTDES